MRIRLQPWSQEGNRDYPFVIVGLPINPDTSSPYVSVVSPKTFDTGGNFGGPRPLVRDDGLRDQLLADDNCSNYGIETSTGFQYYLFRTGTPVNDQGRVAKYAMTKLGLKAKGTTEIPLSTVQIGSGGWEDDNDSIPEADEAFCNAGAETSMLIKQPAPATRTYIRDLRRDLTRGR